MADWYTKTVLTVIAICLLFLTGREELAPSRSYELSKIVTELSDVSLSIAGLNKTDPIQKVAICDNSGYCIDLRTKTGSNGIVSRVLPVDANEPPRVTVVR
jgi:hypothetical protein